MPKLRLTCLLAPMAAVLLASPLVGVSTGFAQDMPRTTTQDGMKAPASSMSKSAMSKQSMSPDSGMGMQHGGMAQRSMSKTPASSGSMSRNAMSADQPHR